MSADVGVGDTTDWGHVKAMLTDAVGWMQDGMTAETLPASIAALPVDEQAAVVAATADLYQNVQDLVTRTYGHDNPGE